MNILIIDHESFLHTKIEKILKDRGFDVYHTTFDTFNATKDIVDYNLVLLDVPAMSSESYLTIKKIRDVNKYIPIIALSPFLKVKNIEKCFILGCNDYLKKPIIIDELVIKLNFWLNFKVLHHRQTIYLKNGFTYDFNNKRLKKYEQAITLTSKEVLLLDILLKNRGWFVPTAIIIQSIWDGYANENQLRVLIYKLRKKVDKTLILSMRDVGYKIDGTTVA